MRRYDYNSKRKRRKKSGFFSFNKRLSGLTKLKVLSYFALFLLAGLILTSLTSLGLFIWYGKNLPQPDKVREFEGLSTIIYSRDNEPLYDIYSEQNIVPVQLKEVPEDLKNATIAIEDKDFYKHQGFSLRGMARGAFRSIFLGKLEGGSTLTQQLVKNVLLSRERTLPRKIKELMLSIQIERKYSKDQILEMYLNNVPYGGTAWGAKTAAQTYFDKDVSELTLLESAVLAGLPQAPTLYSPFGPNPTLYIERTKDVLRRMEEDGFIDKEERKKNEEKLNTIVFSDVKRNITAPHFVMYVRQKLVDQFGEAMVQQGGLRVVTSLDLSLQRKAEEIVQEELGKLKNLNVSNGAVMVTDPRTGQILAMVGSKDYFSEDDDFEGKFNVAVQGLRQPGSAIKPITYATALEKGYTPASLVIDAPVKFPGAEEGSFYEPENYDGEYKGPIQLRYGLGNSINVAAVKFLSLVGVKDMLENAYGFGLTTLEPTNENVKRFGLSITLGGGEVRLIDLNTAFGVFASAGERMDPVSILKVSTSDGKELFSYKESSGEKVLDEKIAFLISDILADNKAREAVFGFNSLLNIQGSRVAVKTGTTNDFRDNWTVGYTKDIVVGVWVGNNDNSPMNSALASGVTGAAPIWRRIILTALQKKEDGFLSKPDGVISAETDALAGGLPFEGRPVRQEYFIKGTEPQSVSSVYKTIKVSKADPAKKANEIEIAAGEYEEKKFIDLKSAPSVVKSDYPELWKEGIDAWLKNVEDPQYHPPTETSSRKKDEVVINIKKPAHKEQLSENSFFVKAEAFSLSEVVRLELFVDGESKKTVHANKLEEELSLEKGAYTIKLTAQDAQGNKGENEIKIGVQAPWDYSEPASTSTPVPSVTPTSADLSPTPSPI